MLNVPFNHPAWIDIDLVQFKANLHAIKQHIGPQTKICLAVKANAYGHGLIPIAKAAETSKVDYLGVSCLQEGILLRQAHIKIPILVFGAIHVEQIQDFIDYDLEFTISSQYKAKLVAYACAELKQTVKVHLEIDTGMNRTGVRVETAPELLNYLLNEECFMLKGVYSHLATADEPEHPFTSLQIKKFIDFLVKYDLKDNKQILCHLANSAGVACFKEAHLDMVRPGLLAFGYYPRADIPEALQTIKSFLSIRAKISYFKKILKGEGVSYNHTHIAKDDVHLLTIPLGYGDGLRRCLSNKASILLNGIRYPMVGNICMDQFMVDIGRDPGYVGDIVTIVGKEGDEEITIQELSHLAGTIPYEILCGFNDRLPRIFQTETQTQTEAQLVL
jgi:alanine racemase